MWQNIIITCIIVICAFFLGRKFWRQLSGRQSGCGGSCKGCNDKSADSDTCKTTANFPKKPETTPPGA